VKKVFLLFPIIIQEAYFLLKQKFMEKVFGAQEKVGAFRDLFQHLIKDIPSSGFLSESLSESCQSFAPSAVPLSSDSF